MQDSEIIQKITKLTDETKKCSRTKRVSSWGRVTEGAM